MLPCASMDYHNHDNYDNSTTPWLPDVKHTSWSCDNPLTHTVAYWSAHTRDVSKVLGSNPVGGLQASVLAINYHGQWIIRSLTQGGGWDEFVFGNTSQSFDNIYQYIIYKASQKKRPSFKSK